MPRIAKLVARQKGSTVRGIARRIELEMIGGLRVDADRRRVGIDDDRRVVVEMDRYFEHMSLDAPRPFRILQRFVPGGEQVELLGALAVNREPALDVSDCVIWKPYCRERRAVDLRRL